VVPVAQNSMKPSPFLSQLQASSALPNIGVTEIKLL